MAGMLPNLVGEGRDLRDAKRIGEEVGSEDLQSNGNIKKTTGRSQSSLSFEPVG